LLAVIWGLSGCAEQPASQASRSTFVITVTAQRSPTEPLGGVNLLDGNKKVLGTTDSSGKVTLRLTGAEGDTAELTVKCPDTYASPEKPVVVGLRHLAAGSPQPTFRVECQALIHTVVIGLRTDNGPNLPVVRLNQVVGQTDAFGAAHILLEASTGEQISLLLKTPENLRPQNPTLTFIASDHDELVLLEQKFSVVKRKVHVKPRPKLPQKI
jgi:hypothetical protein